MTTRAGEDEVVDEALPGATGPAMLEVMGDVHSVLEVPLIVEMVVVALLAVVVHPTMELVQLDLDTVLEAEVMTVV
jgi:hypothetical protein